MRWRIVDKQGQALEFPSWEYAACAAVELGAAGRKGRSGHVQAGVWDGIVCLYPAPGYRFEPVYPVGLQRGREN